MSQPITVGAANARHTHARAGDTAGNRDRSLLTVNRLWRLTPSGVQR